MLTQKRSKKTGRFLKKDPDSFNSDSPLYWVYCNMKARCLDKKSRHYKNYGGRGISVCEKWLSDSISFFLWVLENGYREGLTLDRKKNNEGYSPENCQFITRKENNDKRRITRHVVINGEYFTSVMDAAKKHNVSYDTIMYWCGEHNKKYKARENCRCVRPYGDGGNHG